MVKDKIIKIDDIQSRIVTFRRIQVMIDRDLAELYNVETKVLNQAVKRNIERFPDFFRFQLTEKEKNELVTNCDRFNNLKHSSSLPYAFTEQGVAMLSAVLKSETAVKMSVQIMSAFVAMRHFLLENAQIFKRMDSIELKQFETDKKLDNVLNALGSNELQPKQGIFYDGQIFDAYKFVCDLIRKANKSIVLIDNFIDETVLDILTKRKKNVSATIYTKNLTSHLKLDLKKHNEQYSPIEIKEFEKSHDRFLIIDEKKVYHIGASLKDLGKKWFAFSKMEIDAQDILTKLKVK
jgi:hypothetical protein